MYRSNTRLSEITYFGAVVPRMLFHTRQQYTCNDCENSPVLFCQNVSLTRSSLLLPYETSTVHGPEPLFVSETGCFFPVFLNPTSSCQYYTFLCMKPLVLLCGETHAVKSFCLKFPLFSRVLHMMVVHKSSCFQLRDAVANIGIFMEHTSNLGCVLDSASFRSSL